MSEWIDGQINRPLQSEYDVGRSIVELVADGMPLHRERWKNWDNLLAVDCAMDRPALDPILDAGACRDPLYPSAFLPGLSRRGYRNLTGCNIDEKETVIENGIYYDHADITASGYAKNHFGFVACLSVIEHGVDEFMFLDEMARILMPGGQLFVSFDYWKDKIDAGGRTAFGAPVRVFDAMETRDMCSYAHEIGLSEPSRVHYDCKDPVVKWLGMEYTFMNLLFEKH